MTYIEHLDDKFDFGKFKGCSFAEVAEYSPSYIVWVVSNINGEYCVFRDSVIEELRIFFPKLNITPSFETMRNQRIDEYEYIKKKNENYYDNGNYDRESVRYEHYAGSYVQDEMGYSDEDIDTIFDGEPDAYWNID